MVAEDFTKIPKVELHAHLNGSLSVKSIEKLHKIKYGGKAGAIKEDYVLEEPKNMEEVFKFFPIIQDLTTSYEGLKQATIDVITDFYNDGVIYLELRTTPKKTEEMTKEDYIKAVVEGISEVTSYLSIVVRLLLSIDRRQTIEYAKDTVRIASNYALVVGVDLSGDPSVDGRKFLSVLEEARSIGLGISVHLAEVENCLEEVDDFLDFAPDRIGHGTYLNRKEEWINKVTEKNIPIEICLTSNLLCKTIPTIEDSHLGFWMENDKTTVILGTDDQGLMSTNLSREFKLAAEAFKITELDAKKMAQKAFAKSFMRKDDKQYVGILAILE